jgi:hypothetical protein
MKRDGYRWATVRERTTQPQVGAIGVDKKYASETSLRQAPDGDGPSMLCSCELMPGWKQRKKGRSVTRNEEYETRNALVRVCTVQVTVE